MARIASRSCRNMRRCFRSVGKVPLPSHDSSAIETPLCSRVITGASHCYSYVPSLVRNMSDDSVFCDFVRSLLCGVCCIFQICAKKQPEAPSDEVQHMATISSVPDYFIIHGREVILLPSSGGDKDMISAAYNEQSHHLNEKYAALSGSGTTTLFAHSSRFSDDSLEDKRNELKDVVKLSDCDFVTPKPRGSNPFILRSSSARKNSTTSVLSTKRESFKSCISVESTPPDFYEDAADDLNF